MGLNGMCCAWSCSVAIYCHFDFISCLTEWSNGPECLMMIINDHNVLWRGMLGSDSTTHSWWRSRAAPGLAKLKSAWKKGGQNRTTYKLLDSLLSGCNCAGFRSDGSAPWKQNVHERFLQIPSSWLIEDRSQMASIGFTSENRWMPTDSSTTAWGRRIFSATVLADTPNSNRESLGYGSHCMTCHPMSSLVHNSVTTARNVPRMTFIGLRQMVLVSVLTYHDQPTGTIQNVQPTIKK